MCSDEPSLAGDVTTRWTSVLEAAVDPPVKCCRDGERNSELSCKRQQRIAASQPLTRPLLHAVSASNAELGVVELVQRTEGDHRDAERTGRHDASDDQRLGRERAQRSVTDDAPVAVDGYE